MLKLVDIFVRSCDCVRVYPDEQDKISCKLDCWIVNDHWVRLNIFFCFAFIVVAVVNLAIVVVIFIVIVIAQRQT